MTRLIHIEDNPADARLIARHIANQGLDAEILRVEDAEGLLHALEQGCWDAVLTDYSLPKISFEEILKILREKVPDVPVIVVSGSLQENAYLSLFREGLADFILKDDLLRLCPAIERSTERSRERKARIRAEEALAESESRYRFLFENLPTAVLAIDPETDRILQANKMAMLMFGYRLEELLGMEIGELGHPEDPVVTASSGEDLVSGPFIIEKRYVRKDGSFFWARSSISALKDDAGKTQFLIGSMDDVTDRVRSEQKLIEQDQLLQEMGNLAHVGGWEFDPATGNGKWTEEVARIHEVDPETAASASFGLDFYHGENRIRIGRAVAEAVARGTPYDLELELVTAKGKSRWVRTICHPVVAAGRVVKVRGAIQDITERKMVELAVRESEERLHLFIEHAPVAIAMFDREMRYMAASRRWLSDYGIEVENIVGHSHHEFFPDIPDRWNSLIERGMQGEVSRYEEDRFEREDGSVFWLDWEMWPWRNADESVGGIILYAQIINERKMARDQLRLWAESFEKSGLGLAISDAVSNIFLAVNPAFAREHGYEPWELTGKPVMSVFPPELAREVASAISLLDREGHAVFESEHLAKDGRRFPVLIDATTLHEEDGRSSNRIAYVLDITERKRSEERIAHYVKELEASMEGTLMAISGMVEMRDPFTAGHERRVGLIAADIARSMGWSEEKCRELQLIGLVIDIGKIAIPADILSKPGRLAQVEFNLVKEHARFGSEILQNVQFPIPIASIILQHHERMDGSGYPFGLKGGQILPEARILAVADVAESMISHRPYRPALGIGVMLEEIESGRGTKYDEKVVDALLEMVRHRGYVFPD